MIKLFLISLGYMLYYQVKGIRGLRYSKIEFRRFSLFSLIFRIIITLSKKIPLPFQELWEGKLFVAPKAQLKRPT